mgnify:CR=1 FL=1
MKTLLLTDLHLSHKPLGLLEAQKECILKIFEEENPDEVIIMGDLVMVRRPPPLVLSVLHTIIKTIEQKCSVVLLRGNHDSDNRSDDGLTILSLFESPNVKVVTQLAHDYDKQRTYIPHYEDQNRIKAILSTIPKNHSVFGHFGYAGCLNSCGDADFSIGLDNFNTSTYLGHIHRFRQDGKVTILGTPYSTNFGESGKENYYAILDGKDVNYFPITHGPRYLMVERNEVDDRLEEINDANYFTILRVNLSPGDTDPPYDAINVDHMEVKFRPAFDEERLSEFTPSRDLFSLNEVILEDYIDSANTELPKEKIMEGFRLIKDED